MQGKVAGGKPGILCGKRRHGTLLDIIGEDARELGINESGTLVMRTKRPVVVENFSLLEELGRFVVERDHELLGAGIITETFQ